MADSGQRFIKRNRPPRVQIEYKDPYNSEKMIELPFVMGVLSDLSGNASEVEKLPLDQRKLLDVDMDNFDKRMEAIKPGVAYRVADKLSGDGTSDAKLGVAVEFREDGRLRAGRRCAADSSPCHAFGGAPAAGEFAALHGRQGSG